jgi:hypothetical protein
LHDSHRTVLKCVLVVLNQIYVHLSTTAFTSLCIRSDKTRYVLILTRARRYIRNLQTLPQPLNMSLVNLSRLFLKAVDALRRDYWQNFHPVVFYEV